MRQYNYRGLDKIQLDELTENNNENKESDEDMEEILNKKGFRQDVIDFAVLIKSEIRKDSQWKIKIVFSKYLIESYQMKNVIIITNVPGNEEVITKMDGCFYIELKARSKLCVPIKEVAFNQFCIIFGGASSYRINKKGEISMDCKFFQRPRNVFHKHMDMIILISTLFYGMNEICSTKEELIFRGGTGRLQLNKY